MISTVLVLLFFAIKTFGIFFDAGWLATSSINMLFCLFVHSCVGTLVMGPQQFKFNFQLFQHHRIESILNLSLSLAETIISNSKDLWHIFLKTQV